LAAWSATTSCRQDATSTERGGAEAPGKSSAGSAPRSSADPFVDIGGQVGIRRRNESGSPGLVYIFENIGSGCAVFDFDDDGLLDVFVNNAGTTVVETVRDEAGGEAKRVKLVPGPGTSLYRQLPGDRVAFEDVTARAGVAFDGWGTGVAVGDIENDGDLDLFVGAFGTNRLYVNDGDGTFTETSRAAGLGREAYASSAAFFDYDKDGDLDLYVVNYLVFDLDEPPNGGEPCLSRGVAISCPPNMHRPMNDTLYSNRGDGTFEDVTVAAGMEDQPGAYGLGVAVADLDRDGWPDIYVANDTQANFLWQNRGDGTFEEVALFSGVALSENAQGQSGMGVDLGDVDGDGWIDIQVNNFSEEPCAYYRNLGDGTFADLTAESGLGQATFMSLSWGSRFFDYDHDGRLDLMIVSGHIQARAAELGVNQSFPQCMQVFRNVDGRRFLDVSAEMGEVMKAARNHRGLTTGDIDRDGDLDVLVTLLDGPPLLLENNASGGGGSVAFELEATRSNREGIGARIEIAVGATKQVREVTRGGSYLAANDVAAHFGVGAAKKLDSVRIDWPSGAVTTLANLATGRTYRVRESDGRAEVVRTFARR